MNTSSRSFLGYSNTFGDTSSRPGSSVSVSAGQSVAPCWSTRRFPKSSRITVKTWPGRQDRRLPCRLAPFRAIPIPPGRAHGIRAEAPHMRAVAKSQDRPRADPPCGHAPGPSANRARIVTKKRSGFDVFPGCSANRARFSGSTRLRFAEDPRPCLLGPAGAGVFTGNGGYSGRCRGIPESGDALNWGFFGRRRPSTGGCRREPPFPVKTAGPARSARLF